MDACHLLLGRPWEFDRWIIHDGFVNTYSFKFENRKFILRPSPPEQPTIAKKSVMFLQRKPFEQEMRSEGFVFLLLSKSPALDRFDKAPPAFASLVHDFQDVFPEDLPQGLPPLRDILHRIDFILDAALPNRAHYRMCPSEHEELHRQVEELVTKGFLRESLSPCALRPFIGKFVVVYFDDILILSATISDHIHHLTEVLQVLWRDKFYATLKKCDFGSTEVQILGYIVSDKGLAVDPGKVSAIQSWPKPSTITEVQSFHGLASFYRRFVDQFSGLMAPITDTIRDGRFVWTQEADKAFGMIKQKLCSAPILALSDFSLVFELHCDASKEGIGAVLSQR